MKLYVLRPATDHHRKMLFGYDCNDGFVVRAKDEAEARELAHAAKADEGDVWLNPQQTRVDELTEDGPAMIILTDFNAG